MNAAVCMLRDIINHIAFVYRPGFPRERTLYVRSTLNGICTKGHYHLKLEVNDVL